MNRILTALIFGCFSLAAFPMSAEESMKWDIPKVSGRMLLIGLDAYQEVLASGKYILGPQDEFFIHVTGMDELFVSPVHAEGGLYVPMVGFVNVGGLRLSEARKKIEEQFRHIVKIGEIHIELSTPRSFPIPVLGLVQNPGISQGSAVERVSQVVGALAGEASRRNIRLFHTRSLTSESRARVRESVLLGEWEALAAIPSDRVDLLFYETTGDPNYNPFVEDGDLIVVPPQTGQMGAFGAVQQPNFFEFVAGDDLSDLLTLAFGLAPQHDKDKVFLFRYAEDNKTMTQRQLDITDILSGDQTANLYMQPGDQLVVRGQPEYHKMSTITITGEVSYPGIYVVDESGSHLSTMIEQAGGFTPDATMQESRVIRLQVMEKEKQVGDPELERVASIPPADRTEEENQYYKMMVREKPGQIVVDFEALFQEGDQSQNILLLPGDVVRVPRQLQTVMVSGQAASPGAVIYNPDFGVSDYLQKAGGFGWRATDDVRVIKASTGEIKLAKEVARVEPGDRIWIKGKPTRDYWNIFTQTMFVIGEAATIVLLYVTITK